jgi:cyanate permease
MAATIALAAHRKANDMWLILLEAFGALAVLVLIVWWTMFSGRRRGERE